MEDHIRNYAYKIRHWRGRLEKGFQGFFMSKIKVSYKSNTRIKTESKLQRYIGVEGGRREGKVAS